MKINIICSEAKGGWIYTKFIKELKKYSKHTILVNSKESCDLTHYLPYYETSINPSYPSTIWSSHQENREPLKSKFISAARSVDFAFVQAKKYGKILDIAGITNKQIVPGVDDFHLRTESLKPSKKLRIGYVGRSYKSSNRKNPSLLEEIGKLSWVELKITNGKVAQKDLPAFYHSLDLVISPSLVEGGPMALTESLRCGVPVLCFADVGMADEFNKGVWKVKIHSNEEFIKQLYYIWKNKLWCSLDPSEISSQVELFTWKNFVDEHDKIWSTLKENK